MNEGAHQSPHKQPDQEQLISRLHRETVARLRSEEKMRHLLRWLSLLILGGIIVASLLPYEFRAQGFDQALARFLHAPHIDPYYWYGDQWTGHAIAYGSLAFCLMGALLRRGGLTAAALAVGFVFAVCLGFTCLLEFGQTYVLSRNVSGNDISAGGIGALVGMTAWFIAGPALLGFGARIEQGGATALMAGAALYAAVYALLMLFPFDIIFSFAELRHMLAEGKSFLGAAAGDAGLARGFARMVLEILLAAPLGFLLVRRGAGLALIYALAIGVGVEIIQFALVTGQSTWFGAVTRTLGIFAGWLCARWLLGRHKLPVWDAAIWSRARLAAVLALLPYAVLILLLDRWQAGGRPAVADALALLGEVRWIPFFYMYSGDEVVAAVSAMSQFALYLPPGVLIWVALGRDRRRALWVAGLLAFMFAALVEAGGLFMAGYRPDPTNLLLSVLGALAGVWLAGAVRHWLGQVFSGHDPAFLRAETAPGGFSPRGFSLSAVAALVLMAGALLIVLDYPVGNGWLLAGILAYGLLLRSHPMAWLVLVPAALPVLDFTVLTGRVMVDPFDALILVTLAMELWRQPLRLRDFGWRGAFLWLMLLYILAYVLAVLSGLLPLGALDANSFTSPYSGWQAVWAGKGFFTAVLLAPFLWRAARANPAALLLLAYGMAAGLLLCGLVVLWERFLFTGLLNFNTEYRAIGAFGTMRTGGAHLDAYLATALPFAIVIFFLHRNLKGALAALVLALIGLYGTYVTFSRGPYLAVLAAAIVLGVGLLLAMRRREGRWLRLLSVVVVGTGLAAAAAVPFLNGSFLAKRFETTAEDSGIRWSHWQRSLDMREKDMVSQLFGMGPGRFPAHYFAKNDDKIPMASIVLGQTGGPGDADGHSFLRMRAGQSAYLSQFVRVKPGRTYTLEYRVRAYGRNPLLTTPICEKWITDSFACAWVSTPIPEGEGQWHVISQKVQSGDLGSARGRLGWITSRPVKFTLYNGAANTVLDVTDIRLLTDGGRNLVDNGDFSSGLDFWYMTVDDHLPWHIKNIFVAALFDQGYVGLVLFLGLMLLVGGRLMGQVVRGDRLSAVYCAAFAGFLVVGIIDSPFDTPRLAVLFYLLLFAAYYLGELTRDKAASAAADNAA